MVAYASCSDLRHVAILASHIGLPTRGADILSARHVQGFGGGYCRVLGRVGSIDPAAAPIRFEVNLPETWNGKALQFGGGAFDGYFQLRYKTLSKRMYFIG
ncbi:tannase/feruloyl esterase family alpha/beta hydrolase [Terriglobus sp.]|uniref:tannase/feruloyl esterase family alpha/beta hydrolase n=1 Tax=Terriglobus sp. TaxID=1889013 RepID=UPI003B000500